MGWGLFFWRDIVGQNGDFNGANHQSARLVGGLNS